MRVKHHGYPGHFMAARDCLFRLHTSIAGRYRVSTVGDYRPSSARTADRLGPMALIGWKRYFETMVFELDPATGEPRSWTEIEIDSYNSAEEAEAGHAAMVDRYCARVDATPDEGETS